MFVLGLFFALLAALVTFPSLWDLIKAAFYVGRRLTVHYAPAVAAGVATVAADIELQARAYIRMVLYWILAYFAALAILIGIALAALKGGNIYIFGLTTFIFALAIWPLQKKLAFLANLSRFYLPTPLRLSEPKISTLLMVIPIYSGVTAMLFPHLFYNGFGVLLLIVLMAGTAWIVAFPTEFLVAAKAVAILTVLTIASWVVLWLIPAHVEAGMNYFQGFENSRGQDNLLAKLRERPVLRVNADVLGWTVETYQNGDPVLDADNFAKVKPCMIRDAQGQLVRMSLSKGAEFKTLDVRVSVDAGEPLVQVYTPNSDGTWIVTEDSAKCWIPVSKTELASKPTPTPQPVQQAIVTTQPVQQQVAVSKQPADPSVSITPIQTNQGRSATTSQNVDNGSLEQVKTSHRVSLYVPAKAPYQSSIFVKRGQKIIITASGKVNSMPESWSRDGSYRWVGPDGWGKENPGFITQARGNLGGPLPSDYSYLALAARVFPTKPMITDGKWELVGSQNTIVADRDGYLHFVVNEKTVDQYGHYKPDWLENNQGGFQVEVSVL